MLVYDGRRIRYFRRPGDLLRATGAPAGPGLERAEGRGG